MRTNLKVEIRMKTRNVWATIQNFGGDALARARELIQTGLYEQVQVWNADGSYVETVWARD